MSLENRRYPRRSESAHTFARLVAEDERLGRLLVAVRIELEPFEHGLESGRRYRHRTSLPALGRLSAENDQLPLPVDVAETKRQHLTLTHPRVERSDDHRSKKRLCDLQESRLFILRDPPATLIVLAQLSDQRFRSTPERRAFDVLAANRPVHHVPQQLDRPVDRGVHQFTVRTPIRDPRLPEIRDEVLDVSRPDFPNWPIAEVVDERLEPVVDRPSDREALREHVPLFVDLRKLAEGHRTGVARWFQPPLVECPGAHGILQIVEGDVRFGLGLDLSV